MTGTKRRLGRPPDSTGDETRIRILAAARDAFAQHGYAKTTNGDIARAAGITTGAIYHYFDSKPALFAAVTDEVTQLVLEAFREARDRHDTFVDRFRAVLDAASRLHAEDPSLARFSAIYPMEMQRHPELGRHVDHGSTGRVWRFLMELAQAGADAGELPADMPVTDVGHMLGAVTLGLASYGALIQDHNLHRGAVVVLERIFERALDPAPRKVRRRQNGK